MLSKKEAFQMFLDNQKETLEIFLENLFTDETIEEINEIMTEPVIELNEPFNANEINEGILGKLSNKFNEIETADNYGAYIHDTIPLLTQEEFDEEVNRIKKQYNTLALHCDKNRELLLTSKALTSYKIKNKFPKIQTSEITAYLNALSKQGLIHKEKLYSEKYNSPSLYAEIRNENEVKSEKKEIKLENKHTDKENKIKQHGGYNNNKFGVKYVMYDYNRNKFYYNTPLKHPNIYADTFNELELKVKEKGYEWSIVNLQKYKKCCKGFIPPKSQKKDDDLYKFPKSYNKYPDITLNDDGTFSFNTTMRKTKKYENYILLKIFYWAKADITVKQAKQLKRKLNPIDMAIDKRLSLAFGFCNELSENGGKYCDIVFEIFKNDYEVPFYITFDSKEDVLLINGHDTNIPVSLLKEWVETLNDVFNPEFEIVKIMHDNSDINQKYLFWTLMNYGNDFINEIIGKVRY